MTQGKLAFNLIYIYINCAALQNQTSFILLQVIKKLLCEFHSVCCEVYILTLCRALKWIYLCHMLYTVLAVWYLWSAWHYIKCCILALWYLWSAWHYIKCWKTVTLIDSLLMQSKGRTTHLKQVTHYGISSTCWYKKWQTTQATLTHICIQC